MIDCAHCGNSGAEPAQEMPKELALAEPCRVCSDPNSRLVLSLPQHAPRAKYGWDDGAHRN